MAAAVEDVVAGPIVVVVVATVDGIVLVVDVGAVAVGFSMRKSWMSLRAATGGCGMATPLGSSAMVMSWPFTKRTAPMSDV